MSRPDTTRDDADGADPPVAPAGVDAATVPVAGSGAAGGPVVGMDAADGRLRQTRRDKANRATRGVLAAVLCLESLVVLLVPRAIAQTSTGLDPWKTITLLGLALVLLLTGFLLRRPWGIGVGSVLQLAVLATGVLTAAMFAVAVIFIAIWLWVLTMRRDLVGTPGGARLLIS